MRKFLRLVSVCCLAAAAILAAPQFARADVCTGLRVEWIGQDPNAFLFGKLVRIDFVGETSTGFWLERSYPEECWHFTVKWAAPECGTAYLQTRTIVPFRQDRFWQQRVEFRESSEE